MSDEEEDDGCDLFADSEKEEEDAEDADERSRPVRRAVTPSPGEVLEMIPRTHCFYWRVYL